MRIIVLWTIVLAVVVTMVGLFLSALPDTAAPVLGQLYLEGKLVPRDRGRGIGRTRRDGGADQPEIVAKPPVSGPAGSL
jgi:hypothetical protein